ncbi:MAG: phytoene desaturase family protein [Anaerolineae bacterium]
MSDPIVIIGAGIGGLSAAIHLAAAGRQVLILEQNQAPGGKMGEIHASGYRWDTGPSVITMRHVFEELFAAAGRDLADYLTLKPVEPLTRYFYPDGTVFDASRDLPRSLAQIHAIDERDVEGYLRFLAYAARLHRIVGPVFIYDRPPRLDSLFKVSPGDALHVDGLRTMSQAINGFVRSPHLRQLLGRFATYVGASPYQAPATLNVIAHVELNQGVWYPQGGIYRIAHVLARLAGELGVELCTGCAVRAIQVERGRVRGVRLEDGDFIPAQAVVANVDVATVYEKLLPAPAVSRRRLERLSNAEPSCSGFILLLGVRGSHPELAHHNIFFSSDYPREFREIFEQGLPPTQPTVYLAITAKATPGDAPPGCENWFVLVNAPALGRDPAGRWDWEREAQGYRDRVLAELAARGFDVRGRIEAERILTPLDIERLTGARRGALYGASSNQRWAAFRRPHNRAPDARGLYFAGGTAHPGGGVPMVTLSGKVASQLLLEDGY